MQHPNQRAFEPVVAKPGPPVRRSVTRATLSDVVCGKVQSLKRRDGAAIVDEVLEEISATLARGQDVKLTSFGTFQVRRKAERVGRNPKTGEEARITARRTVVFKPARLMSNVVDGDPSE